MNVNGPEWSRSLTAESNSDNSSTPPSALEMSSKLSNENNLDLLTGQKTSLRSK